MPAPIRTIFLLLLAFALPVAKAYAAPSITFSPTSYTVNNGDTFQVNVAINVDNNSATGADVYVNYNTSELSAQSFSNGDFFSNKAGSVNNPGTVEMHNNSSPPGKSGSGTYATITFKALKDSGSSTLSIVCPDTDILTVSGQNILTCAQSSATVTFGSGSGGDGGSGGSGGSGDGGSTRPPGCTDAAPGSAPQITSAVSAGSRSVRLTWESASDPVSYYLLSYGLSSGKFIYGNPNIGGKDATSYTVGNLNTGTRYYFAIRAGNGCMPGNFSNTVSAIPGGGGSTTYVPPVTPIPTIPMITETPFYIPPTPEITPLPTEPVQESTSGTPWWLIGAVLMIIVGSVIFLTKRNKPPGTPPPTTQQPPPPFESVPPPTTNVPPPSQA